MECKILIIGSNPSNASKVNSAFDISTKSGKTLQSWFEHIRPCGVLFTIAYSNVYDKTTPGNRPLNKKEIVEALPILKNNIESHKDFYVIAVGKTAVKALTLLRIPFYELPHPSGLNRQLNDLSFIQEKIKGLQEFLTAPQKDLCDQCD